MIRKLVFMSVFALLLQISSANAGAESEELKSSGSQDTASECFEGFSRAMFEFNYALDRTIFEPVAKGYRALPVAIRKGTGNAVDNLRSLLTISNNILQGDFHKAGNTAGRFVINSTAGILGIWDPAAAFGLEENGKEDFGQTLGVWGTNSGCYFVLPILGPTTTRDAAGLIVNSFLDPVFHVTHNSEVQNGLIGNDNYSEHNYYITITFIEFFNLFLLLKFGEYKLSIFILLNFLQNFINTTYY